MLNVIHVYVYMPFYVFLNTFGVKLATFHVLYLHKHKLYNFVTTLWYVLVTNHCLCRRLSGSGGLSLSISGSIHVDVAAR